VGLGHDLESQPGAVGVTNVRSVYQRRALAFFAVSLTYSLVLSLLVILMEERAFRLDPTADPVLAGETPAER